MKSDNLHINDRLLARFLSGETNNEEQGAIIHWIEESDDNRKYLDQLESVWLESGKLNPKPIPVDKKLAWFILSNRIDKHETKLSPFIRKNAKLKIAIYASIAASILALVGIFNWYTNELVGSEKFILANNTSETLKEILPDGSEIYLNESAKTSYETTSNNQRIVTLDGEAFFNVKRDTSKPFIVHAGIGGVKVLGTSFQVKRKVNGDIAVDVSSGKVELFRPNKHNTDTARLILIKDEGGLISNKQDTIIRVSSNSSAFFWVDKRLSFRNKQLKEVFKVLESCYDIQIISDDPEINSKYYTSSFIDDEAEDVIRVISDTYQLSYTKEKNVFTIFSPQSNE
jgi:ferric-dicitrate binding protein FerR (iron transport regulator)